ncbi:hypothetical protein GEZ89_02020 [Streptococcus mitis]|uniref:HNH endonuclease n=1 Tax=Streptococcus mitis TaxID=28037 RepID=A0A7X1V4E0_STRMT|nr:hypothetical protein [Streptococcus mitis]MQQ51763.1 hypothetical protein [Streptococcus mitis]
MMHLKLPNYPQEFVDAYIKFMISKYIDSVVSRYFVRIIKNNFREDLEATFGYCGPTLIKSLIREYCSQEDYFNEINNFPNQQDTEFKKFVSGKIGTKNKFIMQKIRNSHFNDYKRELWYNNLITKFEQLMNRRSQKIKNLVEEIEGRQFSSFAEYFEILILLEPQRMEAYINNHSNNDSGNDFKKIKDLYNLSEQITIMGNSEKINCFMIQNFIDSDSRGLLVCPYCNRNYINTRDRSLGAEMDHFYNKDTFPMFSISLYNFIPSCSTCNRIKGTKTLKINPYLRNDTQKVKFDLITDLDGYRIEIKQDQDGNLHTLAETEDLKNDLIDILKLDEAYKVHKIEVREMLDREKEYNEKYREDLKNMFLGEEIEIDKKIDALIYGDIIFTSEDDLINKSLGKFRKDVYEKIKGWRGTN